MARVLVTGGTGFIGSHICDRLIELGHEVVCFDNMLTSDATNIEHLIGVSGFTFIQGDIRDIEVVSSAIRGCTHVCHQAALGSVPRSIEDPVRTNDINLVGGLNILVSALENEIERFVFASSSSVYGGNKKIPFSEKDNVDNPISIYAASKKANELMANTYSHLYGLHTTGLRFFTVYGPWGRPDMAMYIFANKISKGKKKIDNSSFGKKFDEFKKTKTLSDLIKKN